MQIAEKDFPLVCAARSTFAPVPGFARPIPEDNHQIRAFRQGSRLDNLVQIGHNVSLGRCCVIVAQVGIAGSTVLEDFVQIGGQAAVAGHLRVGKAARIGAQAGVISDVSSGAALVGSPAQPRQEFFRQVAALKQMVRRRQQG